MALMFSKIEYIYILTLLIILNTQTTNGDVGDSLEGVMRLLNKFSAHKLSCDQYFYHNELMILIVNENSLNGRDRCEVNWINQEWEKVVLDKLDLFLRSESQLLNMQEMVEKLEECEESNITESGQVLTWGVYNPLSGIVPGTKWCGVGTLAETYHQLGILGKTDSCCRAHDLCPIFIRRKSTSFGLYNRNEFTMLHCTCEKNFYNCLGKVNSDMGNLLRFGYFLMLRQCISGDPYSSPNQVEIVNATTIWS